MNVRKSELGVATYLAPNGPLIEENLKSLDATVSEVTMEGRINIVVDLSKVPFLDSRGLESLVDLHAKLREAGGSLRLAGPNEICKEILAMTRLDDRIPVFGDVMSAGRSFL